MNDVLEKACSNMKVEIPDAMINEELTRMGFNYTEITTESMSNDENANKPLINNC